MKPVNKKIAAFVISVITITGCKPMQPFSGGFNQRQALGASQGYAPDLVFDPEQKTDTPSVPAFQNAKELQMRGGLPNFFYKIRNGKPVTVAFMGGSVTQMDNKYRNQTALYMKTLFPGTTITFINAGVSGTGTDLGACRLGDQVLKYKPDLVFLEFAVNGAFAPGMEGIIRQLIRKNPATDICLLYSVMSGQEPVYARGRLPEEVIRLEKVAAWYQLPAIFMGLEPVALVESGRWLFKGAQAVIDNKPVFSDGIHPTEAGGYLYASAICRSLEKMEQHAVRAPHRLPVSMLPDNWEDATMVNPDAVQWSRGWEKIKADTVANLRLFAQWFPFILRSEQPGASFSFTFEGDRFGVFDVGGPGVGQLKIQVDGKELPPLNRFNRWCNNRYRGQFEFVQTGPGSHHVVCTIDSVIPDKKELLGANQLADITENPEKYDHRFIYLGKILIKGRLVAKTP